MDIFNEAKLLQFRVYLESMLAENKYREFSGKSLAYTEENFDSLAKEIENFINKNQNKTQEELINKYKQALDEIEKNIKDYCRFMCMAETGETCEGCPNTEILDTINRTKE